MFFDMCMRILDVPADLLASSRRQTDTHRERERESRHQSSIDPHTHTQTTCNSIRMLLGVELDVVFPFAFLDAIHSSVYFRWHTVVLVLWQTCRPTSSLFSYVRNIGSIMPFNWHLIPRVLMTVGYPIGHVHNVHATGGSQTHCCSPIRRWWWFTSARERRQKHIRPSKTRTHSDGQNNLLRHREMNPVLHTFVLSLISSPYTSK